MRRPQYTRTVAHNMKAAHVDAWALYPKKYLYRFRTCLCLHGRPIVFSGRPIQIIKAGPQITFVMNPVKVTRYFDFNTMRLLNHQNEIVDEHHYHFTWSVQPDGAISLSYQVPLYTA
jgi:hypothetical protein